MKNISVNIRRHGSDPNLVYIKIQTNDGEITLKSESISVFVEGSLLTPNFESVNNEKLAIESFK